MRYKIIAGFMLLIISFPVESTAGELLDLLEPGSFGVGGKLQFDGYYHKLGDGWSVSEVGGGINKNYHFNASTASAGKDETVFGETFFLNVAFRPNDSLKGDLDFEAIGHYADRYWMTVNNEHRLKLKDQSLNWNRAEIAYDGGWLGFKYFRNAGHSDWSDKGDLFNLFPAHFEENRYLRVSGRSIPEGYELDMEGKAGRLELTYGSEVIWDHRQGVYANYNFILFGTDSNLMYRNHIIPYGDPDERMSAAELSSKIGISNHLLHLAVMYQPFRLDRQYTYVDYVDPGKGYLGTVYDIKNDDMRQSDALGYSAKLTLNKLSVAKEITFKLSHLGLAAGNKNQFDTMVTERFARSLTGCFEYTYRKPLLGPLPLAYEGTLANRGPAFLEPRDKNSPFWVNWDNREANLMSFTLTYDPTPDTWFYGYEANQVSDWNINPQENARLTMAAKYSLARYFTGTDRLLYWNALGEMIWEGPLIVEPWATDGYVGDFAFLARLKTGKSLIIFNVGGGESLASNGFAYTASTAKEKPATSYFKTGLSYERKPYAVKLSYSQDAWGPESWHQSYGQAYDKLYQAHVSRKFGDYINVGAEYVGARELDDKYYAPELGYYDEFRLFLTLSFGPLIFFTENAPVTEQQIGQSPEPLKIDPPQVSLRLSAAAYTPSAGKNLEIYPSVSDTSGVDSWRLEIINAQGQAVKTATGKGHPPAVVRWDGQDDVFLSTVPAGAYSVKLEAKNRSGKSARTDPILLTVADEAPKQIKITETERGLLVSMSSKVLFDSGKSDLKPEASKALDEVVKILNTYKDNKISVEGHTDSRGNVAVNQALSEKRAVNVANYLSKSGISDSRMSVKGLGADKPLATNSTAVGRETNRRVEVIILKK